MPFRISQLLLLLLLGRPVLPGKPLIIPLASGTGLVVDFGRRPRSAGPARQKAHRWMDRVQCSAPRAGVNLDHLDTAVPGSFAKDKMAGVGQGQARLSVLSV